MNRRLVGALIGVWLLVLGSATPAEAYLDPGAGSMLLQLLLGGVAGFAVLVRLTWRRLTDRFGTRGPRRTPPPR